MEIIWNAFFRRKGSHHSLILADIFTVLSTLISRMNQVIQFVYFYQKSTYMARNIFYNKCKIICIQCKWIYGYMPYISMQYESSLSNYLPLCLSQNMFIFCSGYWMPLELKFVAESVFAFSQYISWYVAWWM